ncbi:MAG: hypothetical protein IJS92_05080 [Paludibacteraceae bacterium]|nr:hypothetical protein [Paludibacteraceae bacterium]
MAHGTHIAVYPPQYMVVAEPRQRHDALYVWRMRAADERLHSSNLIAAAAQQPTIIITRTSIGIRIDQSPMPECRISFCQCEAVVVDHPFVRAQAVCQCNGLLGMANRHA